MFGLALLLSLFAQLSALSISVVGKSYWKLESKITSLDESQGPKKQIGNIRNLSAALIWNNKHFLMKQMEFTKLHSHPLPKWRGTPKNSIIEFLLLRRSWLQRQNKEEERRSQNQITLCFGESGARRLSQTANTGQAFVTLANIPLVAQG